MINVQVKPVSKGTMTLEDWSESRKKHTAPNRQHIYATSCSGRD